MQSIPAASSEKRRFRERMGEKLRRKISRNFSANFSGRHCRAAGRSRHAEGLARCGAEIELLRLRPRSVSQARCAPPVRSSKLLGRLAANAVAVNHSLPKRQGSFRDSLIVVRLPYPTATSHSQCHQQSPDHRQRTRFGNDAHARGYIVNGGLVNGLINSIR